LPLLNSSVMKFLAISREIPPVHWDSLGELLKEEAIILHTLYLSDQVREFYFTDEGEAALILECQSREDALALLQQLPLVRNGMIRFDLLKLNPYTGFARLMNRENL
jgi:hypothetical protein